MKVTIKDIARESNVSISAVSLVLNDRPCRISKDKKQLIKSIANKYNYSPNQIARSLATQKTKTLGLIIPDIENIFFSSLIKSIEEHCREAGYMLFIVNSDDAYQNEAELLRLLVDRGVDGIFIVISNESYAHTEEVTSHLNNLSVPYILVDRDIPEHKCNKALFDNKAGAYMAVKHLLDNGHKKIGCISSPLTHSNGKSRLDGYQSALLDYGYEINKDFIIKGNYRTNSGYSAAEHLLNQTTAVFASNDMMALGFLKYLYGKGLTTPENYSIVSYDNAIHPYLLEVELTSVEQNVADLGREASSILIQSIEHKENFKIVEKRLMPELIKRNSVKHL